MKLCRASILKVFLQCWCTYKMCNSKHRCMTRKTFTKNWWRINHRRLGDTYGSIVLNILNLTRIWLRGLSFLGSLCRCARGYKIKKFVTNEKNIDRFWLSRGLAIVSIGVRHLIGRDTENKREFQIFESKRNLKRLSLFKSFDNLLD